MIGCRRLPWLGFGGSLAVFAACAASDGDVASPSDDAWRDPVVLQPDAQGVYQLEMKPTKVTLAGRDYCLRTYNGVLSPMIDVAASSSPRRLRVDFRNSMTTMDEKPVSGSSCVETAELHHFNATNLHTHGLHVSPDQTADGQFQSDNVLLELHPGMSERYRFDIDEPQHHPAGTFWFHAHVHGSTAIQVANGVAGALLVRGDIDAVPEIAAARERVFLFQQIPYDDPSVQILVGECTDASLSIDDFPLAIAAKRTLVNGVLAPHIVLNKGAVERWRFIHGGISQELALVLRQSVDGRCNAPAGGASGATRDAMRQIAADGLTFSASEAVSQLLLDPGYRADVMLQAPSEPGTYCLIDGASPVGLNAPEDENVIAILDVRDAPPPSTALPTDQELRAIARPVLDCAAPLDVPVRPFVFAQQKDTTSGALCEGQCPQGQPVFNIDCRQYHPADEPLGLPFGKIEEWQLASELSDHPFHIHVNPFTLCAGSAVHGETVTTPHWRDTLLVRKADSATGTGVDALTSNPIRIRTHYEDYRGKFVMHCHKLQHEDEGMMRMLDVE